MVIDNVYLKPNQPNNKSKVKCLILVIDFKGLKKLKVYRYILTFATKTIEKYDFINEI